MSFHPFESTARADACSLDYTLNAPALAADVFCILPTPLCAASHYDNFALSVVFWSALQLSWTVILLGAQLWQIARQLTTLEVSNLGRYGFMGGKTSANAQQGLVDRWHADRASAPEEDHEHGPNCDHSAKPSAKKGKGNFLLKILGIDRFTNGKAAEGLAKATKGANPFDLGIFINCLDFWKGGRELDIDYLRFYEIPSEGLEKRRKERKKKEKEEKSFVGGKAGSTSLRRGNGATYERVAMDEV